MGERCRWALWILGSFAGCGDNRESPADAAKPDASACTSDTTFFGVVRAFSTEVPFEQFPLLAGVTVCNADRPDQPCATTDGEGAYVLDCVPNGDVVLSFARSGYTRTVWLRVAGGTPQRVDATLLTDLQNTAFYQPVGATFPMPGYGSVALNDATHLDGIAFSAPSAIGPFYSADGATLSPTATGTIGDGVVFFIAPVGTLAVEITPPAGMEGLVCGQAAGGFLSNGRGLSVPVFEHTEVGVLTGCR